MTLLVGTHNHNQLSDNQETFVTTVITYFDFNIHKTLKWDNLDNCTQVSTICGTNLVMAEFLSYNGQRLEPPPLVVNKVFTPESNVVKVDIWRMEMISKSNAKNRQVIQTHISKLLSISLH